MTIVHYVQILWDSEFLKGETHCCVKKILQFYLFLWFQGNDDDPENNLGGLLDLLESSAAQGCCNNPELEENVKSETAVAGLCGFANFANTCYMNSGLQCLLATPTVVKYFTECYKSKRINKLGNRSPKPEDVISGLTGNYASF